MHARIAARQRTRGRILKANNTTDSSKKSTIVALAPSEVSSAILLKKLEPLQAEAEGGLKLLDFVMDDSGKGYEQVASVIMIRIQTWRAEHLPLIERIRKQGFQGPILVDSLTSVLDNDAAQAAKAKGVTFLHAAALNEAEFLEIVRRALNTQTEFLRVFRRTPVRIAAEMLHAKNTLNTGCVVYSVSRGGLGLDFKQAVTVTKGEPVSIHLSPDMGHDITHILGGVQTLHARVVWIRPDNMQIGVEFFDPLNSF